jgi:dATP pyrophosphohydrolase
MPKIIFKIAEVVVFRMMRTPEFLVLKRSDNEDIYPGLWQIVSGGIKRGEKAYEAVAREIKEEIGIKPEHLYNTPLTNTFYFYANDSVNVSPVFAAEVNGSAEVKLSREHKEFRWLEKDDAIALLVWPGQKEAIRIVSDYILSENPSRKFMEIKLRNSN